MHRTYQKLFTFRRNFFITHSRFFLILESVAFQKSSVNRLNSICIAIHIHFQPLCFPKKKKKHLSLWSVVQCALFILRIYRFFHLEPIIIIQYFRQHYYYIIDLHRLRPRCLLARMKNVLTTYTTFTAESATVHTRYSTATMSSAQRLLCDFLFNMRPRIVDSLP